MREKRPRLDESLQSTRGGKRCEEPGCDKSVIGPTSLCKAHEGGKRCEEPGCSKSARGSTGCTWGWQTLRGARVREGRSVERPLVSTYE